MARWVPNLPFLDGTDLQERLAPEGVTLAAGNDAQMALLARSAVGAAVGLDDAILLAIGTGIGSAVLTGGRIAPMASACSFGWASADVGDPGEDRSGWLEPGAARTGARRSCRRDRPCGQRSAHRRRKAGRWRRLPRSVPWPTRSARFWPVRSRCSIRRRFSSRVASPTRSMYSRRRCWRRCGQLPPHLRGITLRAGVFGPRAGLVGAAVAAERGREWWRRKE